MHAREDTTMCLKLTLKLIMRVSSIMWPSLTQTLHLPFLSHSTILRPSSTRRKKPHEVNFKKIRKTKHFPEKMDFLKSQKKKKKTQGASFHAKNQIAET